MNVRPSRFRDRPTADLIVAYLAALVGVVVILMTLVLVVSTIWYPDHELGTLASRVATLVSSLIALIAGYMAGRGVSTNGVDSRSAPPP